MNTFDYDNEDYDDNGHDGDYDNSDAPSNRDSREQLGQYQDHSRDSPRSKKGWLVGCSIAFGVFFICCCVSPVGMYFWSANLITNHSRIAAEKNPVIQKHIGTITKFTLHLEKTGNEGGDGVYAFEVEGDKGSGIIIMQPDKDLLDDANAEIISGELRMKNGNTYDLLDAP